MSDKKFCWTLQAVYLIVMALAILVAVSNGLTEEVITTWLKS